MAQQIIVYTEHLKNRLLLRNIDEGLPKEIFEHSRERYIDNESGYAIATMQVELHGRTREVMVAYAEEGDLVKLLTVHPLKDGQKEGRVQAGRWRKI